MEYIMIQKEINMKVIGKMVNLMELEFLIIQLEKCMKENLKMMKKME